MDSLPGAVKVLVDWIIMLLGTIFTFFKKKEEPETSEEA